MSDVVSREEPATAAPAPETEPEVESEDNRTAREKVLDHFADCDDPDQSVAQIIQGTGLSRNTCEQAIFRAVQSEQLQRVSQGVYRLAPPKPPSPPKPEPPSRNGHTNDEWIARIEAWQANPATWNEEDGPPPNDPNHRIPLDVVGRFKDRQAREAKEAAASKQEAADAALRDQQEAEDFKLLDALLTACNGNYSRTAALADPRPIHVILASGVPVEDIITTIRCKVDRRSYPKNQTIGSWSEPWFLKAVAEQYARWVLVPRLVEKWRGRIEAQAQGDVSKMDTPAASQKPTGASEASPAVQVPPEPENAPAPSPPQPDHIPDGNAGDLGIEAPDQPTRDSILAAFARNRVPPQPVEPPPRPPERQAERQTEAISQEGWEELVAGYRAGVVNWNVRRLGPEPGQPGCRAPRDILRSFGL
jgi:hypothetical protein